MKKLIAANWKMNKTLQDTKDFFDEINLKKKSFDCDVAIFPPFLSLSLAKKMCADNHIIIGAQNCHEKRSGAFTGEISCEMLKNIGINNVIIGHSERREYFNETDEIINKKLLNLTQEGLGCVLCVGETKEQRLSGKALESVKHQIKNAVLGAQKQNLFGRLTVAYEPRWAIGSGAAVSGAQANEMCRGIHECLTQCFDSEFSDSVRVLYGGSVSCKNAEEILFQPDIGGVLVGGASLNADEFIKIINIGKKSSHCFV